MEKKKILILGTGWSQLDLALKAKEMNMELYGIGAKKSGPVIEYLDHFAEIDIRDDEKIEEYCRENAIDFIFTMGLEMALPTITNVSEKLNLNNFFNSESMSKLEDKYTWRQMLGDVEGNLKSFEGSKVEDFASWNLYPAFIKPVDGSGQRGVYKVDNYEDVKEVFPKSIKHSRKGVLIIEEFADGEEISVNSFMYNGKLAFYIASDRISYTEYPGGIIKKHVIPCTFIDEARDDKVIKNLVETVCEKMGFENGHIYFQLKVGSKGVKLIEFTPRYDGCHMWKLVKEATELDLLKCSLEWLSEKKSKTLEDYKFSLNDGVFVTEFISDKPATKVDRNSYRLPEDYRQLQWYYEDGQEVKSVTGYLEKVGYTITRYPENYIVPK